MSMPLPGTKHDKLRICKRFEPSVCYDVPGTEFKDDYPRRFAVHLPAGKYDAAFVDVKGELAWQQRDVYYASTDPICGGGPSVSDIQFLGANLIDKGVGEGEMKQLYQYKIGTWDN